MCVLFFLYLKYYTVKQTNKQEKLTRIRFLRLNRTMIFTYSLPRSLPMNPICLKKRAENYINFLGIFCLTRLKI